MSEATSADGPDVEGRATDEPDADDPATVVITQRVATGHDADYQRWQDRVTEAASGFPGYRRTEVTPPPADRREWTVIFRFDTVPNLRAWLNSERRQQLMDEGASLFEGPASLRVLRGGQAGHDELMTVVVSQRVPDGLVDDFLAWQDKMTEAEAGFEGFRGAELFRPVPGVQDEWTAVYRFDTAAHLDAWLSSPERAELLDEGERFGEFRLDTVGSSFGSWFDFRGPSDRSDGPAQWKTAVSVLVGLYPTVFLLTLGLAELWPGAPMWASLLVGNVASVSLLTWVVMPLVTRTLGPWLQARPGGPAWASDGGGLAVSLAFLAACALAFYLTTRVVWTLP